MLNSRHLLNLFLLCFVIALASFIIFSDDTPYQEPKKKITALNHQDINRLELTLATNKTTILVKNNAQWRIIEPLKLPANTQRINALLHIVESESQSQFSVESLQTQQNIDQYGLKNPILTITANNVVLKLGTTEPIHGYRYVLIKNTIHLFNDPFSHFLRSTPSYFISNAVLPSGSIIEEIVLPKITLSHNEGRWQYKPSQANSVSQTSLLAMVQEWQNLQSSRVTMYTATQTASGQAIRQTIRIKLKGQNKHMAFIKFKMENEIVLARPEWSIQYHLGADQAPKLFSLL